MRPDQIYDIISAEIPEKNVDKDVFDVVTRHMIHGPCGLLNTSSPCVKEGKCSKRFPKKFTALTVTENDGNPQYRLRSIEDGGKSVTIRIRSRVSTAESSEVVYESSDVNNRWIVPYLPILSKTFQAHINVEYCNSLEAIKYICKYMCKGNDMADFAPQNPNDEIEQYQTGRYISTDKALWRIFSFQIHERYPSVLHLAVHLENGQRTYYTNSTLHQRASTPPQTTLTAFFSLCSQDPFARTLLYTEVPTYCVDAERKRIQTS